MSDINPLLVPLIEQLRLRRESLGISQEELTERCGFCEKQIAKWETGLRQPSGFHLSIWAESLGMMVLAGPTNTLPSEQKRTMAEAFQARLSEIAIRNSCTSSQQGKSRSSNFSPSTTSSSMTDLFSFHGVSLEPSAAPDIRQTSATGISAAA